MNAQQLKASILQQAIEGKLVPQLPEEGIVDQLGDDPSEVPFDIPSSWQWVQLKSVCEYIQRGKSPKYSDIQQIPVIAQKCNQWEGFQIEKAKFIDPETINKYKEERWLQDMDLLWNSTGLGTLGRVAIYETRLNPYGSAVADSHVTVIRTNKNLLDPKFLYLYISSHTVQDVIESRSSGSTKQKELNVTTIENYETPLPPLAEQKRIIAKIEELMPLVEEYGKAYDKLQMLNKELPNKLKASILQEAIQGKLVPQLPEDGTVEQIGTAPSEVPFDIPPSWKWITLKDLFRMQAGKFIKASEIKEQGQYPCYGGNGLRGFVDSPNRKGRHPLIGRQGALCGNIHVVDGEFYATEHAIVVDCGKLGDPDCVGLFLTAMNLNQYATATAQPGLAVTKIEKLYFPLPPLAEQKHIVAKVEQLLEHVDAMVS